MTRRARWIAALVTTLAAVPPAVVAVLVARHARNVPWKDQWGMVDFFVDATQGVLRPAWLFWQVNEHRMPVALVAQGVLAWFTQWDVRWEAGLNVVLAACTLAVLARLIHRTIGSRSPIIAAVVLLACSLVTFSPAGGINWTWGTMNANFMVGLATAAMGWQLAGWRGGVGQTIAMLITATLAAFAFGTGLALLLVLPPALAALSPLPWSTRLRGAGAAAAWAVVAIGVYFTGWHQRIGHPRAIVHWDRPSDYGWYVAAYLGAATGTTDMRAAAAAGFTIAVLIVALGIWTWRAAPAYRAALVPWMALAATAVLNAFVTAFGRLGDGLGTALFVRYLPSGSWAAIGLAGVWGIAATAAAPVSRRALAAAALLVVACASASYWDGALRGTTEMSGLAARLDRGAPCLADCDHATDACLLLVCWDATVARRGCHRLEAAGVGPRARRLNEPPR